MSKYAEANAWLIDAVRASDVTDFGTSEFARLVLPALESTPVADLTAGARSILRHVWGKKHGQRFSARYLAATAEFDRRIAPPEAPATVAFETIPMSRLEAIAKKYPKPFGTR